MNLQKRVKQLEKELAELKNCCVTQTQNVKYTHEVVKNISINKSVEEQFKAHLSHSYL